MRRVCEIGHPSWNSRRGGPTKQRAKPGKRWAKRQPEIRLVKRFAAAVWIRSEKYVTNKRSKERSNLAPQPHGWSLRRDRVSLPKVPLGLGRYTRPLYVCNRICFHRICRLFCIAHVFSPLAELSARSRQRATSPSDGARVSRRSLGRECGASERNRIREGEIRGRIATLVRRRQTSRCSVGRGSP